MKRIFVAILFIVVIGLVAVTQMSAAALGPYTLQPGDTLTGNCSTSFVGTVTTTTLQLACATETPTATSTPTVYVPPTDTETFTPSPIPTFTNTPTPTPTPTLALIWSLPVGGRGQLLCPASAPSIAQQAASWVIIACGPTWTPTETRTPSVTPTLTATATTTALPRVTGTPLPVGSASVFQMTNPNSTNLTITGAFSNDGTATWIVPANSSLVVHLSAVTEVPSPYSGTLTLTAAQPFTASLIGFDSPTPTMTPTP